MTELEQEAMTAVRAGIEMRSAQKLYFKLRADAREKNLMLERSKQLEKRFDNMADEWVKHANEVGQETGR
jgi:hypothetical protein